MPKDDEIQVDAENTVEPEEAPVEKPSKPKLTRDVVVPKKTAEPEVDPAWGPPQPKGRGGLYIMRNGVRYIHPSRLAQYYEDERIRKAKVEEGDDF